MELPHAPCTENAPVPPEIPMQIPMEKGSSKLAWNSEDDNHANLCTVTGESFPFDFCIVVPKAAEKYMKDLEKQVKDAGFLTDVFESFVLKDEDAVLYCRIGLPLRRCQVYADAVSAPGRLDPQKLRKACAGLVPPIDFKKRAARVKGSKQGQTFEQMTKQRKLYPPFLHIFTAFSLAKQEKHHLFMPWVQHNSHKLQRRLLTSSCKLPDVNGEPCRAKGAGFNIKLMDKCGTEVDDDLEEHFADKKFGDDLPEIASVFLLHDALDDDSSLRSELYHKWIRNKSTVLMPWKVPVQAIREYFGDQFGFYILFISTFSSYCLPLGFLGLIIYVVVQLSPVSEKLGRQLPAVMFSPFLVIGMSIFMTHFRRRQATFAKEWGCYAWDSGKVEVRPEFLGVPEPNPIDGSIVNEFRSSARRRRQVISWTIVVVLLAMVVCLVFSCFAIKVWSARQPEGSFWHTFGGYIATIVGMLQVHVGNFCFLRISVNLTRYENWKTDADYSDALVAKLFLCKLFNTFIGPYYAAFLKDVIEEDGCPGDGGCLHELANVLAPVFISGAVMSLVTQVGVPLLKQKRVQRATNGKYGNAQPTIGRSPDPQEVGRQVVRRQFHELTEYDNIEGPIADHMEIAIQFCYMVCFGAAFPVSPFICAAANVIQMRQDGFKLLYLHFRMISMDIKDLGVWEDIYIFLLYLAMPTNMGILVFTTKVTSQGMTLASRWVFFFMGCIFYYVLFQALQKMYPAVSRAVSLQLKRQSVYGNRVIEDAAGEDIYDDCVAEEDGTSEYLLDMTHEHDSMASVMVHRKVSESEKLSCEP